MKEKADCEGLFRVFSRLVPHSGRLSFVFLRDLECEVDLPDVLAVAEWMDAGLRRSPPSLKQTRILTGTSYLSGF